MSSFFFQEPFYSLAEVDRLIDDALGTFNRSLRNSAEATAAARSEESNRNADNFETQVQRRSVSDGFQPKMDIHENSNDTITASFELPGLSKENINIELHRNRLVVSGETRFEKDKEESGWIVKERRRGRFSRSIPLPEGTESSAITAAMENGVLTVTFPKVAPQNKPRQIQIA